MQSTFYFIPHSLLSHLSPASCYFFHRFPEFLFYFQIPQFISSLRNIFYSAYITPGYKPPPRLLAHPKSLMKLYKPRALMWDFTVLRFPESCTVFWSNPGSRKYLSRPWGSELQTDPGRGLLGLIFAGYVRVVGLLEPLPHYNLFCGQIQTPSQSLLGKCNFRDPNLVTFCLFICLIRPFNLHGSS